MEVRDNGTFTYAASAIADAEAASFMGPSDRHEGP
jgi:hypothetical protein